MNYRIRVIFNEEGREEDGHTFGFDQLSLPRRGDCVRFGGELRWYKVGVVEWAAPQQCTPGSVLEIRIYLEKAT